MPVPDPEKIAPGRAAPKDNTAAGDQGPFLFFSFDIQKTEAHHNILTEIASPLCPGFTESQGLKSPGRERFISY